jgi:hypothetical protein
MSDGKMVLRLGNLRAALLEMLKKIGFIITKPTRLRWTCLLSPDSVRSVHADSIELRIALFPTELSSTHNLRGTHTILVFAALEGP